MRFYIFGSDKDKINVSPKKALYTTDNLTHANNRFSIFVKEIRNHNLWLVVDFEHRKNSIWGSDLNNDNDEYLPFFILREYHYGFENKESRTDNVIVSRLGFDHEFKDNIRALEEYIFFKETGEYVNLKINYIKEVNGIQKEYTRIVADTNSIIGNKKYRVRRFKLSDLDWIDKPLNRDFTKFYNYKIYPEPLCNTEQVKVINIQSRING